MDKVRRRALARVVLLVDGFMIVAAMLLAFGLHAVLREHVAFLYRPPAFQSYAILTYLTIPLWLGLTAILGLHRCFERSWGRAELFVDLIKLHVAALVGLAVLLFITQVVFNRSLVGLFLLCTFVLLYAERVIIGAWLRYQYRRGNGRTRVLLVGEPTDAMRSFVDAADGDEYAPRFLGYLANPTNEPASSLSPVGDALPEPLGDLGDLEKLLHDGAVDQVLFFPPYDNPERVPKALRACEERGVPARFSVDLGSVAASRPQLVALYDRPFVSFELAPKRPEALAIKHTLDVIAAAVGILLVAPLLLLVALVILVTMGRPVFHVQERVGRYGRRFHMFKFRTMVRDAEARKAEVANEMTGPVFKAAQDPRITRLGGVLRRTSIDELPQLFNVLGGTMSLVGPRPLVVGEQQRIHGLLRRRLSMKPGITGLWQVSGRSGVDFDDWMALDLQYVDQWSLWNDLVILLRTIPAVLLRRGAK